jgi:DNA-binding transcriptional MerR regulator
MSNDGMREPVVRIGDAAALYGVTPSTLRWWERAGVLEPPGRIGGKRVYLTRDLRRIGLAYLFCVTGRMPLEQAAPLVSARGGGAGARRRAIEEQIDRLDRQIEQLRGARAYLEHLLWCPGDDIAANCPELEDELALHTPRGRLGEPDLLAAARAAGGGRGTVRKPLRDGRKAAIRYEKPPAADGSCAACGRPLSRAPRGRPPKHCSPACRQRAYRARTPKASGG